MARVKVFGTAWFEGANNVMTTLAGADVNAYEAGTTTPVDMYANQTGGSPIGSLQTLLNGYYEFWVEYKGALKVYIDKLGFDPIERDFVYIGHGDDGSIKDHEDVSSTIVPNDGEVLIYNDTEGEYRPGPMSASGVVVWDAVIDTENDADPEGDFITAMQDATKRTIAVIGTNDLTFDHITTSAYMYITNVADKYVWFEYGIKINVDFTAVGPMAPQEQGFFRIQPGANIDDYDWKFENMYISIDNGAGEGGFFSFGQYMGSSYNWLSSIDFTNCIFEVNSSNITNPVFIEVMPSGNYIDGIFLNKVIFDGWYNMVIDDDADDGKGVFWINSVHTHFWNSRDAGSTNWWKKFNNAYQVTGGFNSLVPKGSSPHSYLDADTLDGYHASDLMGSAPSADNVSYTNVSGGVDNHISGSDVDTILSELSAAVDGVSQYVMYPGDSNSELDAIITDIGGSGQAKITFMPGAYSFTTKGAGNDFDFGAADVTIEGYGEATQISITGTTYTGSWMKTTGKLAVNDMYVNALGKKTYIFDGGTVSRFTRLRLSLGTILATTYTFMSDCYMPSSNVSFGNYANISNCQFTGSGITNVVGAAAVLTGIYNLSSNWTVGGNGVMHMDGTAGVMNFSSSCEFHLNGSLLNTASITLGSESIFYPGQVYISMSYSSGNPMIILNDNASIQGGVIRMPIDPGQTVMDLIQVYSSTGNSAWNINGVTFLPKLYDSNWDVIGGASTLTFIKYSGAGGKVYMSDCIIRFDANGFDIMDDNSKIRLSDSGAYVHLNNLAYEFFRSGGPLTFTALNLRAEFSAASFRGCTLVGHQPDFQIYATTALDCQVSGSRIICNSLTLSNRSQVTGSQIEGNIGVLTSGADTIVNGCHVTGSISGSVEINANNTS